MTRGSIGVAAVLGVVLGVLLGGLFATALGDDGADQVVAVQADTEEDEFEPRSQPATEAPLGLIQSAEQTAPVAAAEGETPTPGETSTPREILPPPTAGAVAPTPTPTVPPPPPTSTPQPAPPVENPTSAPAPVNIDADVLPCSDNYVAVTRTASDTSGDVDALFDELANNPQTRAADVTKSCSSLAFGTQTSFVAYIGPFGNVVDACATASNAGAGVSVVRLSAASEYQRALPCPSIGGFMTHQGRYFVVDVPQGSTMIDSDLDVGYGFRTTYEGPGYFVTIETSRNEVAESGASARESAAGVAALVSGASPLRQIMIGSTEVWYFEFVDDGFFKVDLFFNLGVDGYAVIGADSASMDTAFGLASHTVASLQRVG